jgi:undecaprenyl-diphosphatase
VTAWDRTLTARLMLPFLTGTGRTRRRLASGIAHSGDSALWLVGAFLACVVGRGEWYEGGRRVFLATAVGGGAIWLLKQLFRRRRPTEDTHGLYLSLDVHSFPSGHAGRNACSVVWLMPLLSPPLQIGLFLWLGLLGLSRVALGVHYVSDVLVGFVVGGGIGWWLR